MADFHIPSDDEFDEEMEVPDKQVSKDNFCMHKQTHFYWVTIYPNHYIC